MTMTMRERERGAFQGNKSTFDTKDTKHAFNLLFDLFTINFNHVNIQVMYVKNHWNPIPFGASFTIDYVLT